MDTLIALFVMHCVSDKENDGAVDCADGLPAIFATFDPILLT